MAGVTRRQQPEHTEQRSLFEWASKHEHRLPELKGLHAIPNAGGYKGGFASNKMQVLRALQGGVKKGYPDGGLDVARDGYHGLRFELKAPGKLRDVSPDQQWWHDFLRAQGYLVFVSDNWRTAWNLIVRYLGRADLCILMPAGMAAARGRERTRNLKAAGKAGPG